MAIDAEIEIKIPSKILIKKQEKYQHYHQAKLVSMNILQLKEILLFVPSQMIEQSKSTNFLLGNVFDKQIKTIADQGKKQVEVLQILKHAEQKRINIIFPKDKQSNLIEK